MFDATETSQGLLAVFNRMEKPLPVKPDFILVIDQVRDPGNLGTLLERLNEGLHRKLTLVSAPAGFGKTTLLAGPWEADTTPADLMAKCEYPRYLGPEFTRLLDEAMTRLRAA